MKISLYRKWGLLIAALPVLSGCVTHRTAEIPSRASQPRPAELVEYYTNDVEPFRVSEAVIREGSQYTVHRVELRTNMAKADEVYDIGIEYLEPKTKHKPRPAVLFLPILNEAPIVSYPFATYLANRGIAVAIVYTNERGNFMEKLEDIEPNLQEMVIRQRIALDWLLEQSDIDPKRIGVMGVSMGAIKAALLKGVDERVGPAVFGMAGGNIPFIALNSRDHGIARQRQEVLNESTLKFHEVVTTMRESIRTDPLQVAQHVEPDDVLMFITKRDKVVPTRTQESLRTALGMPEAYFMDTNHYVALIHIFMVRHRAYRFFEESFALNESR